MIGEAGHRVLRTTEKNKFCWDREYTPHLTAEAPTR
jgi:hypothetical protein